MQDRGVWIDRLAEKWWVWVIVPWPIAAVLTYLIYLFFS